MDLAAFENDIAGLFDGDPEFADHPIDRTFEKVVAETGGLATENGLALLDLAVRHLEDGEVYLEVGTYRGTSAIAAALRNGDRRIIAIDNFSQFGGPEQECRANIEAFGCSNIELVVDDAWATLEAPGFSEKVGVYFYDGGHTFEEQYRAFEAIEPHLADHALVIIDDANWPEVRAANRLYTSTGNGYRLIRYFRGSRRMEAEWWNGTVVYGYTRPPGGSEPPGRGLRYRLDSALYGPRGVELREKVLSPIRRAGSRVKRTVLGSRDRG